MFTRFFNQVNISQVCHAKLGKPGLPRTEEITRAALLEVTFSEDKSVIGFCHGGKALVFHRVFRLGDEQAIGFGVSPSHPSAELVQLAQPEPLGAFDDNHRGVRHIDADFDDRRAHEDIYLMVAESAHDRIMICGSPALVHDTRELLAAKGFAEGNHGEPGQFVVEKAFAER